MQPDHRTAGFRAGNEAAHIDLRRDPYLDPKTGLDLRIREIRRIMFPARRTPEFWSGYRAGYLHATGYIQNACGRG